MKARLIMVMYFKHCHVGYSATQASSFFFVLLLFRLLCGAHSGLAIPLTFEIEVWQPSLGTSVRAGGWPEFGLVRL